MGRLKGNRSILQHDGNHVLQADVGLRAVIHGLRLTRRYPHGHLPDVTSFERVVFHNGLQRVEWRLYRGADGPFLDVRSSHFITLPKFVNQLSGVRLRSEPEEEVICTRKYIVGTRSAILDQYRDRAAVTSRHAAEDKGLLDVLGIPRPRRNARELLCGVVQQISHLLRAETGGTTCCRRGPEVARDAMRAAVRLDLPWQPP